MLITRRQLLHRAAGAALAIPAAAVLPDARDLAALGVRPRADWADGRSPGPLDAEPDVRFLLVHHSVSPNDYAPDAVAGLIRGFHTAHTRGKGWPDVAYNFFVDRFGGIWEGRAGSLDGPVAADATGGNQGFAQLCCLVGDHRTEPPSEAALTSLTRLLAALADRHRIDTAPQARTEFVSRGSNRHPAGATVRTPTIAGHRDMSRTECPGDACYALIRGTVVDRVNAARTVPPPAARPGPVERPADPAVPPGSAVPPGTSTAGTVAAGAGVLALAGAVAGAVLLVRRRRTRPPDGPSALPSTPGGPATPPPAPGGPVSDERGIGAADAHERHTRPAGPARARWDLACAGLDVGPAGGGFLVRTPDGVVAGVVAGPAGGFRAALAGMEDAARAGDDPGLLLDRRPPGHAAVAVLRDDRCAVAATRPGLAVLLTPDGTAHDPGAGRVTLPTRGTAAVLLAVGSGPEPLAEVAREAVEWPSLQLGVHNRAVASENRPITAVVNRTARAEHAAGPARPRPGGTS